MINLCALSLSHSGSPQPRPGSSALLQYLLLVGTSLGDSIKSYSWQLLEFSVCKLLYRAVFIGQIAWPKQGGGCETGRKAKTASLLQSEWEAKKRSTEVV